MSYSKTGLAALLTGLVALSFSSSHPALAQEDSKPGPAIRYVKPGAAITLSHNYDGKTAMGEIEAINIALDHPYEDGFLGLSILETPGLEILSPGHEQEFRLSAGGIVKTEISLRARSEGTHYLTLQIAYEDLRGQVTRRSLAIKINAGETQQADKRQDGETGQRPHDGQALILMPAQEVIR